MSLQNRLRNFTMAKSNKTVLAHFPEKATRSLFRLIDTAVVEPQNKFAGCQQYHVSVMYR